jgi:hypothetical protein
MALKTKVRLLTLVHEVKDCFSCPSNSHGDHDDYCKELKSFLWHGEKDMEVLFPSKCPLKEE